MIYNQKIVHIQCHHSLNHCRGGRSIHSGYDFNLYKLIVT